MGMAAGYRVTDLSSLKTPPSIMQDREDIMTFELTGNLGGLAIQCQFCYSGRICGAHILKITHIRPGNTNFGGTHVFS